MSSQFLRLSRRIADMGQGALRSDSKYLNSTGDPVIGSGASHSVRGGINETGGSGFPASDGQYWFFTGGSPGRDMALWTGKAAQNLYLQTFDNDGAGQGWNEVWHEGSDGSGSGLDADTLDGIEAAQMLPYELYHFTNGCLIATDIPDDINAMITLTLRGNGYGSGCPVFMMVDAYQYQGSSQFLNAHALTAGAEFDVDVFRYNGYVHFWFAQPQNYTSVLACVERTNATPRDNRITSITDAAKPSSGVTWSVTIAPGKMLNNSESADIDLSGATANGHIGLRVDSNYQAELRLLETTSDYGGVVRYEGNGNRLEFGSYENGTYKRACYIPRNTEHIVAEGNIYPDTDNTGSLGIAGNVWGDEYLNPPTTSSNNTLRRNTSTSQILYYSSSLRFKENVRDLSEEGIDPDLIYNLCPKVFDERANERRQIDTGNIIGFIAEEIEAACPAIVYYDGRGLVQSYSEDALVALIVGAMKKLNDRVAVLERAASIDVPALPALDMRLTSGDGHVTLVDRR